MGKKEEEFLKKLILTFRAEAEEHIQTLSDGFLDLEKTEHRERQKEILEIIFREVHSLKGAARAVNLTVIESVCQSLESIFFAAKKDQLVISVDWFDLFHETVDEIKTLVRSLGSSRPAEANARILNLKEELESKLQKGNSVSPEEKREKVQEVKAPREAPAAEPAAPNTIRIPTAKLDAILLQAEEMLGIKLTLTQRAADLRELARGFLERKRKMAKIHSAFKMAVQSKALSPMKKITEFIEQENLQIETLHNQLSLLTKSAEQDCRSIGGILENVLGDIKQALMLPFHSLLDIYPKLVRDLSRDMNKSIRLVVQGGDIEIDRKILEEIKDPVTHLIRNAIDHGFEKTEERIQKNKPPEGTLKIQILQTEGNKIEISISDDGKGIETKKIRAAAIQSGMMSVEQAEKLKESEALSLIFQSGFSTSAMITDISGRGLGLAIVREKVEKLGGHIFVETHPGQGTAFHMVLPLTLATFRGVLVRIAERFFVVPTVYVERVMSVQRNEIKTVENRQTIPFEGSAISMMRLSEVLGLGSEFEKIEAEKYPAIILSAVEKRAAFLVDEILDEREVLVKNLGRHLTRVPTIAGLSLLGSGKSVPILHVPDLMNSAVKVSEKFSFPAQAQKKPEVPKKKKSILIAEDSITARSLLKNILETAGYQVTAAVDGVDALTQFRAGVFDLVISDVEMPRMSGFDLIAKIRSDKKNGDLPMILVTALDSREDRERGMAVGANAYIVKSSFDQSNLLEVIKRFL